MTRKLSIVLGSLVLSTALMLSASGGGAVSTPNVAASWAASPANSGSQPNMVDGRGFVWDPLLGQAVLFGGRQAGSYSNVQETWLYDGTTWTQQSPSNTPNAQYDFSMAFDAQLDKVVLFGGNDGTSDLNETWTYDGTTWTQLSPAASPPARSAAMLSWDASLNKLVLFGGLDSATSQDLHDTWTFDGSTWTQVITPAAPSARHDGGLAYDPTLGATVLFGGSVYAVGSLGETWTFDGTTWTQLTTSVSPPPLQFGRFVWDTSNNVLVLYGGFGNGFNKTTYVFDGSNWTVATGSDGPNPGGIGSGFAVVNGIPTYLTADSGLGSGFAWQLSLSVTTPTTTPSTMPTPSPSTTPTTAGGGTTTTSSPRSLATTGGSSRLLGVGGVVLFSAGVLSTVAHRRRRRLG